MLKYLSCCAHSGAPTTTGHRWSFATRAAIPVTPRSSWEAMRRRGLLRLNSAAKGAGPPGHYQTKEWALFRGIQKGTRVGKKRTRGKWLTQNISISWLGWTMWLLVVNSTVLCQLSLCLARPFAGVYVLSEEMDGGIVIYKKRYAENALNLCGGQKSISRKNMAQEDRRVRDTVAFISAKLYSSTL